MKSPKPNIEVECHHCRGKGMIPLSDEMQQTLDAALKLKRITPETIKQKLGWKGHITAMNNRLKDLIRHGFLRRHREGRTFVYTPVKY